MKMSRQLVCASRLSKGVAVLALCAVGASEPTFAAQYTQQEQANMRLVQEFYAALDAANAKGNASEAVVGIAQKYIAPDYKQHALGGQNGRENFIKMFRSMLSGAGRPSPGSSPEAAPLRPPVMEPAKIIALMADGDIVVRITSRGPLMIWNMFRIRNGQLAEHWDAGVGPPPTAAGGPPPVAPKK